MSTDTMADKEEDYCRLCAEPTPKTQLIASDEDVAISSKIATKMQWINVDIHSSHKLPTTICFSCFDLLERTWQFLHNVRSAQERLRSIFKTRTDEENAVITLEPVSYAGKPVNESWEHFQDMKKEIKDEITGEKFEITTVDPATLLNLNSEIKEEKDSDSEYNILDSERFSSDSDMPLVMSVKKKKKLKKLRINKSLFTVKKSLKDKLKANNTALELPLDFSWADCMCRCATCDAQCKNIASLRLHAKQVHTSCSILKCSDCGKISLSYKSMINHMQVHHNLLRYCCDICDKQFTLPTHVKQHRNEEHKSIPMCSTCGSVFENVDLLQDHLLMYSKTYKKRKNDKVDMDLKCEHCSKEFKSRSNLQQHKLVHTERSRDYSCHVCGKMFFTKGALSTHMLTHEEVKPFKCEFCPMTFRARGNLQSHSSLHSGAKPFVCEQCGKSFRVKRHLKSHSIVHTDLMPYVCQYCNKTFRFKTRLNLHIRQHTGAKPYHCVFCDRDFTNGSNFKKHMKRRHNVDTSRKKYNNVDPDANSQSSDHK